VTGPGTVAPLRSPATARDRAAELARLLRGQATEAGTPDAGRDREALGMLGWALGWLTGVPAYDVGFGTDEVLDAVHAGHPRGDTGYARSERAIRAARDLAEAWHWRIRTQVFADELVTRGLDPVALVREVAEYQRERAGLAVVDGDFQAFGKPFRDLAAAEFDAVLQVTLQRHRALNWLCGLARTWDDDASLTT